MGRGRPADPVARFFERPAKTYKNALCLACGALCSSAAECAGHVFHYCRGSNADRNREVLRIDYVQRQKPIPAGPPPFAGPPKRGCWVGCRCAVLRANLAINASCGVDQNRTLRRVAAIQPWHCPLAGRGCNRWFCLHPGPRTVGEAATAARDEEERSVRRRHDAAAPPSGPWAVPSGDGAPWAGTSTAAMAAAASAFGVDGWMMVPADGSINAMPDIQLPAPARAADAAPLRLCAAGCCPPGAAAHGGCAAAAGAGVRAVEAVQRGAVATPAAPAAPPVAAAGAAAASSTGQGAGPSAAGRAKPGRPPHPCWTDVPKANTSSGVCSHCHQGVTANTGIATAHLLWQCPAIPAERRQAFRQELERGFFPIVTADDLSPAKRAQYDSEHTRPLPPAHHRACILGNHTLPLQQICRYRQGGNNKARHAPRHIHSSGPGCTASGAANSSCAGAGVPSAVDAQRGSSSS
jgi:hypothetical protein